MKPHALSLALAIFATACFPKSGPVPGPPSAASMSEVASKSPGATPESIASGRETFIANCNRCHGYPDVKAVNAEEWPGIVKKMSAKAGLVPPKGDDVLHFILAARTDTSVAQ